MFEQIFGSDKKNKKIFIIAEIGKNFIQTKEDKTAEEYLDNARKLIRLAKEAGADAVKFQTHNLEDEQLPIKVTAPHFVGSDRYNWVRRNDLATPLNFWQELKRYCDELDITFFSTPMSRGAAIKLEKVGIPLWKIGSADILDFVMLDYISGTKKPIILSSGMSTLEEIDKATDFLERRNCRVALLHCVSKYPCPKEELNLKTIDFFKKRYNIPVGFSDHSIDYDYVLAAINMGAAIIEKHFSLDRNLWGSDHKVSLTPREFKEMTNAIKSGKRIELKDHGKEVKILQKDESLFRPIFRKALVAGRNIKKGSVIKKDMVYAMRPQGYIDGLPSEEYEKVLGKKTKIELNKYDPITSEVVE